MIILNMYTRTQNKSLSIDYLFRTDGTDTDPSLFSDTDHSHRRHVLEEKEANKPDSNANGKTKASKQKHPINEVEQNLNDPQAALNNQHPPKRPNPEQILHDKAATHHQHSRHGRPGNLHNPLSQQMTDEHVQVNGNSFMLVLLTVFLFQGLIWYWSKRHKQSFFVATLCGLWLFPIIISVQMRYWRMIFVWSVFSIVFGLLLNMSRQKPMNRRTPRYLYSWFYFLYKVTSIMSICGYILFLADFFGFGILIFGPHPKEEREYRSKLLHHQHEAHLHAVHGDENLDSVQLAMEQERKELDELHHGYHHIHFSDIGIYLLFYGLYYGVLARDTAQLCANWISASLGFFNPSGFPRRRVPDNVCAVCNNPLIDHNIGLIEDIKSRANIGNAGDEDLTPQATDSALNRRLKLQKQRQRLDELTSNAQNENKRGFPFNLCSFANAKQDEKIQINCKHTFHGFCIRGWIMIGKRDVCPVCKEKVNLKGIFANPWQKQDRMWSQLLDGVRYLMVWNPVIIYTGQVAFKVFGLTFANKHKT